MNNMPSYVPATLKIYAILTALNSTLARRLLAAQAMPLRSIMPTPSGFRAKQSMNNAVSR
jgi:hypothetical protein